MRDLGHASLASWLKVCHTHIGGGLRCNALRKCAPPFGIVLWRLLAVVDDALEQRRAVEKVFKRDSQQVWMGARGNQIRRRDC